MANKKLYGWQNKICSKQEATRWQNKTCYKQEVIRLAKENML